MEVGGKIQLWDIERRGDPSDHRTGQGTKRSRVCDLAGSPHSRRVWLRQESGQAARDRAAIPHENRQAQAEERGTDISEVIAVAFSADGKQLAAGGPKGEIEVWNLATSKVTMTGVASHGVKALTFSLDGKQLASTGSEGASRVLPWEIATGKAAN